MFKVHISHTRGGGKGRGVEWVHFSNLSTGKSWSARSEQDLRTLTLCSTWKPLMVRTIASSPDPPCVEMVDTTTEKVRR